MEDSDVFDWNADSFDTTVLPGALHVGLLPNNKLKENLHGLLRLLLVDAEASALEAQAELPGSLDAHSPKHLRRRGDSNQSTCGLSGDQMEVHRKGLNVALVHDNAGMTIACGEDGISRLEACGVHAACAWAPCLWRAFEIHLGSAGKDSEKLIAHICSALSESGISILNFSTFGSDLILIQEHQVEQAREFFCECALHGVEGMLKEIQEKSIANLPSAPLSEKLAEEEKEGSVRGTSGLREEYNAFLTVLESPLVLISIQRNMLKENYFGLVKQILANVDKANSLSLPVIETCISSGGEFVDHNSGQIFWAYLSVKDETSLIVENARMADFTRQAVIECPQRWKAVKLNCGKDIPFDEVGIVRTMLKPYEIGVQLLNMSTFKTNVTLVAEEALSEAVAKINECL